MAITGEVGTGKTTICRTLLHHLGDETEVAFLFNPARSATELLQSIAHELGPTGGEARRRRLEGAIALQTLLVIGLGVGTAQAWLRVARSTPVPGRPVPRRLPTRGGMLQARGREGAMSHPGGRCAR